MKQLIITLLLTALLITAGIAFAKSWTGNLAKEDTKTGTAYPNAYTEVTAYSLQKSYDSEGNLVAKFTATVTVWGDSSSVGYQSIKSATVVKTGQDALDLIPEGYEAFLGSQLGSEFIGIIGGTGWQ